MNPSTQRSHNNCFVYYKFAFLSGEESDVLRIAAASCIVYNTKYTHPSLRLIGLKSRCYDNRTGIGQGGDGTYGYKYHNTDCAGSLVCGESHNETSYYHNNDLYQVILRPRNTQTIKFHLIDIHGNEVMSVEVKEAYGNPLVMMPDVMKSANAKNYRFYTSIDGNDEVTIIPDSTNDIYVKYDYDETSAIDLATSKDYNISIGGKYLVTNAEGNVVTVDQCGDNDNEAWIISASTDGGSADPYHVTFASKGHSGKYLGINAEGKLALVDTPQSFFLAKNSIGGYTIVQTASPTTDTETGDLLMMSISYDAASGIIISSSASFGAKTNTELLDIANIYDFHISLKAISSSIMFLSDLLSDLKYNYYK